MLDARSAEAFEFRGRIFAHQGKYAKAINDFTQAIQTDDKRATAFYSRGRSYQFTSKSSLAVMDFQKTVELEPERKYAYHGLGMELVKIGRPNEAQLVWNNAVDDLTRKIESAQEGTCSFEQYFWRGMILRSAKRYNLALEDLNKAIELKPSEYETYYYRGLLYFDIQAKDQAIADFSKSIELNPLFAENYASRASVNDAIRDSKAAERDRKKFKELSEGK